MYLNIHPQAFCTTEMIESYAAIATGNLPELSTQQVRKLLTWECLLQSVWQNVFHFMYLKNNQWIVMTKPLSQRLTKLLHTLKPVKIIDKFYILRNNWPHDNHADRNCNKKVTACTPNPLSCGGTGGCYGSIPQLGYTYIQVGFDIYGPLMSSSSSSSSLSSFFPSPSPFKIIIITIYNNHHHHLQ